MMNYLKAEIQYKQKWGNILPWKQQNLLSSHPEKWRIRVLKEEGMQHSF